jgi:hypothetical protein
VYLSRRGGKGHGLWFRGFDVARSSITGPDDWWLNLSFPPDLERRN